MTTSTAELVARVAAAGLPEPPRPPPEPMDDAHFDELLDAVTRERVVGLLAHCVDRLGWPVTDAQRDALDARHEAMLSVDLVLERLLADTSRRFAARGIPHRALKGPVVARTAYPDPAQRSFGDVDVLVAGPRFDEAIALLTAAGGRARYREPRPNFTARFGKGVCVVTTDGLEIDVHRTFVAGPFGLAIDAHDLFAAPETIDIGGVTIPVPNAEVRFLHACYHTALTSPRITALRDVAQIAVATDLDVDATLEIARRWRGRAVVQRALALTRARVAAPSSPVRSTRGRSDTGPIASRRQRSGRTRTGAAATRDRWRPASGRCAVFVRRVAYGAALLVPDRRYVAEREGTYVRRWVRAWSLVRPSRSAP